MTVMWSAGSSLLSHHSESSCWDSVSVAGPMNWGDVCPLFFLITWTERKWIKTKTLPSSTGIVITDPAVPLQVADLKTRNQQLDSENTELSQRNSKSQADVQDLNQQLARVLKQKEREAGECTLEEWEKERLVLKEELENSKVEVRDKCLEWYATTEPLGISIPFSSCVWSFKSKLFLLHIANAYACCSRGGGKVWQHLLSGCCKEIEMYSSVLKIEASDGTYLHLHFPACLFCSAPCIPPLTH